MAKKMLKTGEEGHLSDLKKGQIGKVLALRRRLLDMGITKGVEVKIKKIAPMGDPIDIELRGYELCIRLVDMQNIDIRVVK